MVAMKIGKRCLVGILLLTAIIFVAQSAHATLRAPLQGAALKNGLTPDQHARAMYFMALKTAMLQSNSSDATAALKKVELANQVVHTILDISSFADDTGDYGDATSFMSDKTRRIAQASNIIVNGISSSKLKNYLIKRNGADRTARIFMLTGTFLKLLDQSIPILMEDSLFQQYAQALESDNIENIATKFAALLDHPDPWINWIVNTTVSSAVDLISNLPENLNAVNDIAVLIKNTGFWKGIKAAALVQKAVPVKEIITAAISISIDLASASVAADISAKLKTDLIALEFLDYYLVTYKGDLTAFKADIGASASTTIADVFEHFMYQQSSLGQTMKDLYGAVDWLDVIFGDEADKTEAVAVIRKIMRETGALAFRIEYQGGPGTPYIAVGDTTSYSISADPLLLMDYTFDVATIVEHRPNGSAQSHTIVGSGTLTPHTEIPGNLTFDMTYWVTPKGSQTASEYHLGFSDDIYVSSGNLTPNPITIAPSVAKNMEYEINLTVSLPSNFLAFSRPAGATNAAVSGELSRNVATIKARVVDLNSDSNKYSEWVDISSGTATITIPLVNVATVMAKSGALGTYRVELEISHPHVMGNKIASYTKTFNYSDITAQPEVSYLAVYAPATVRSSYELSDQGRPILKLTASDELHLYPRNTPGWSDFNSLTGAITVWLSDATGKNWSVSGTLMTDGGVKFTITGLMPTNTTYQIIAIASVDGETMHHAPQFPMQLVLEGGESGVAPPPLISTSKVLGWGEGVVPESLTNIKAVSGGYYFSLALKNDGTVVAWGDNSYGQSSVPAGLNGVTEIATGGAFSLGLKNDGTVLAWGSNGYGATSIPIGLSGVTKIAAGEYHALALKNDGTVVAWGYNFSGQSTVPVGLSGITQIAAGTQHSLALKTDGTVVIWGYDGGLGIQDIPTGLNGVVKIAAGSYHCLALKDDGTVVAWGDNTYGQSNVPADLSGVIEIAAGPWHSLALKDDGTIVAWGNNYAGQSTVPSNLIDVKNISAGVWHSLAVKNDGTIVSWGYNAYGKSIVPANLSGISNIATGRFHSLALINNGTVVGWGNNYSGQAAPPPSLNGVIEIAAGSWHSLALKTDGTVVAWGRNDYGQTTVPSGLSGVTKVSAGHLHSLALRNDGTVVAWGSNSHGQSAVPAGLSGVSVIAAGEYHSLALKNDGTVVAWGADTPPVGLSSIIKIATSAYHSLALKADGTVVAWGSNNFGESNVPNGLDEVIEIAAGSWHSLALKTDGTVVAWGHNNFNQSSVPIGLSGVTKIAAGGYSNFTFAESVPDRIEFPIPAVTFLSENLPDGSYQVGPATKVWRFKTGASPINMLKAVRVSEDTGLNSSLTEISIGNMLANTEYLVSLPINPAHYGAAIKSSNWKFVDVMGSDVSITNSASGKFWLKVKTNRPPVVSQLQLNSVAGKEGQQVCLPILASDPDGDYLNYSVTAGGGSVSSYTTPAGTEGWRYCNTFSAGLHAVTVVADDGHGSSVSTKFQAVITSDSSLKDFYNDIKYADATTQALKDQYAAIHYLTLYGITIGSPVDPYDPSNLARIFKPNAIANQAEALGMIMKTASVRGAFELDIEPRWLPNLVKADASTGVFYNFSWALPYVLKAEAMGMIPSAESFEPNKPVTREWLATMIARLMSLETPMDAINPANYVFADAADFTSAEAYDAARAAAFFGYMKGQLGSAVIFNPLDEMIRADVAVVTAKILRAPSIEGITTDGLFLLALFNKEFPALYHGQSFTVTGSLNLYARRMLGDGTGTIKEDPVFVPEDYTTATIIRPGYGVVDSRLVKNLATSPITVPTNLPDITADEIRSLIVMLESVDDSGNNPVRSIYRMDYDVLFPDSDHDGVRDSQDLWPAYSMFASDANGNGIPDNADTRWNLTARNGSDTVTINNGLSTSLISAVLNDLIANDATAPVTSVGKTGTTSPVSVTLSTNETATIRYTIDGTTPSDSSTLYSTPLSLPAGTVVNYFATDLAGNKEVVKSYTVVVPMPGSCGSSAGGFFATAPTANLCLTGTPSAVTGVGSWNWSCAGVDGGLTSYCNAYLDGRRAIRLPQTGQSACYDASGNAAACPSSGQDGEYRLGLAYPEPRFVDSQDQTIRDNLTGLQWPVNGNVMPGLHSAFDQDVTPGDGMVTWQHALDYVKQLNQESYLGYSDWRLPNRNELESLIHENQPNTAAYLNSIGLNNVMPSKYWTSSSHAYFNDQAWYVAFSGGTVTQAAKSTANYVWPVRNFSSTILTLPRTGQEVCFDASGVSIDCIGSGQDGEHGRGATLPAQRFVNNGDETVTDRLTDMVWTRDGNAPGPELCGPAVTKSWQGALDYVTCLNLNSYLGKADWRLPNRNELASMVSQGQSDNATWLNGLGFINVQGQSYWTSTTNSALPSEAWYVNLLGGRIVNSGKANTFYVWPVRGGLASLAIAKVNGTGTITANAGFTLSNGSNLTIGNATGTLVNLSVSVSVGTAFLGWSGDCTGTDACQILMDKARSVTATFGPEAAVNGICGTVNGGVFSLAPAADLCVAGTATSVSGSGPWNWNCTGSNGGSTAVCKAYVLYSNGLSINSGATHTNKTANSLTLSVPVAVKMRFSTNGTTWPATWLAYATSYSYTLPAGDGLKTIYAQFADANGNVLGEASSSITLDTALPTGTVSINSGAALTKSRDVTIALNPVTPAQITHYRVSNTAVFQVDWTAFDSGNPSTPWTLTAGDGLKTVSVHFKDAAGNISAAVRDTITLDTVAPTLAISSPVLTNSATVAISGTKTSGSTITLTGPEGVTCPTTAVTAAATSWNCSASGYAENGSTVLTFTATDAATNTTTATATITHDGQAPIATITGTPATPIKAGIYQLTVSGDGVTSYSWRLTRGVTPGAWSLPIAVATKISVASTIAGDYKVEVIGKDAAGNWQDKASATSVTWTVDAIAPATTIGDKPAARSNNTTPTLTFSSEEGATFECNVDLVPYAVCSSPFTIPVALNNGLHTFRVRAKDVAGNYDATPATYAWTVDTLPPAFTAAQPLPTKLSTITITGTKEAGSSVTITGPEGVTCPTTAVNAAATSWSCSAAGYAANTITELTFTATDVALNTRTATVNIIHDDAVPTGTILIKGTEFTDSWTNKTAVTLNLTCEGTGTDCTQVCLSNIPTCTAWTTYADTKPWVVTTGNGTKTVYALFRDKAGNPSIQYSDTIGLDVTIPTGSVTINSGSALTNNRVVALAFTAADNIGGSGVAEMRYATVSTFAGADWQPFAADGEITLAGIDGVKTVYAQFRDTAGKLSLVVRDTITLDTAPPALTISTITPTTTISKVITGTKALGSTIAAITVPEGVTYTLNAAATSSATTTWSGTLNNLTTGTNRIAVTGRDLAGNTTDKTAAVICLANAPSGWTASGLTGQYISALAMSPADPDILYAGTFDGIVYKTTDGGANWNQSFLEAIYPYAIAINFKNPDVIYIATGHAGPPEENPGSGGIYKTTDGGTTWDQVLPDVYAYSIQLDPINPDKILVGTSGKGIYRSTDAGTSWTNHKAGLPLTQFGTPEDIYDIEFDKVNPLIAYIAAYTGGIYKTINGGVTWAATGLKHGPQLRLAVAPSNKAIMYAGGDGPGSNYGATDQIRLHKTTNAGLTWVDLSIPVAGTYGSPYTYGMVVNPTNPNETYVAVSGWGVFKTLNGGTNWSPVNSGISIGIGDGGLVMHPIAPQILYLATDNGVFKTMRGAE